MRVSRTLSTEEIVRAVSGILLNGDMGLVVEGICTDSREIQEGDLFIALKGRNFDGHNFLKEVINKGAKGALVARVPENLSWQELPREFSLVLVKDTLYALGELAKKVRERASYKVCAITGSCGKTSTKEMTFQILQKFFRLGKNEANYNNLIGMPMSLLGLPEDLDWVILELGTNSPGEIARLGEIAGPDLGVITCVAKAHLEGLGSLEGVLREKISLFSKVKEEGKLVYFYDQEELREAVQKFPQRKLGFGFTEGADLRIKKWQASGKESLILFQHNGKEEEVALRITGKPQVLNLACALAIGLAVGLDFTSLLSAVREIEKFYSRLKVLLTKDLTILDDTYNANPTSMVMALEYLDSFTEEGKKKGVILGDMKELGDMAKEEHERIGRMAREIVELAIFIGDYAQAYQKGYGKENSFLFASTEECVEAIKKGEVPLSHMVVLVKGSRSMRLEKIVEALLKERG